MAREARTFPAAWRAVALGDLFEPPKSGTWGTEPRGNGEDVRCIRAADFDRERLKADAEGAPMRWVPPAAVPDLRLRAGDVVLEKSGGGEHQPVGAAVIYEDAAVAVCSNFAGRLRPVAAIDPRFANYVLAVAYRHAVNVPAIQQTTGIQNLNVRQFLASPWAVPAARDEQGRVADVLDGIDELIHASEERIRKLRMVGDGLRLRLLGREDGVDDRTLGSASSLVRDPQAPGPLTPYVGLEDIAPREFRLVSDLPPIRSLGGFSFLSGDVLFARLRPYLQKVARPGFSGTCSTEVWVLRPKGVEPDYFLYLWSAPWVMHYADLMSEGTRMPRASWAQLSSAAFRLPDPGRQKAIASTLGAHYGLIEAEEVRVRKLRMIRIGLMDDLVLGRTSIEGAEVLAMAGAAR